MLNEEQPYNSKEDEWWPYMEEEKGWTSGVDSSTLSIISLLVSVVAIILSVIAITQPRTAGSDPIPSIAQEEAAERPQAVGGQDAQFQELENIIAQGHEGVVLGRDNAPITIYEFADFQCPACASTNEQLMPILEREFIEPGLAKLVFIDLPLENIHPRARAAGIAARCANEQDSFWPYHDRLYQTQDQWGRSSAEGATEIFVEIAGSQGLDVEQFQGCLLERRYEEDVVQNTRLAMQLGVPGTPTFVVNGKPVQGPQNVLAELRALTADLD